MQRDEVAAVAERFGATEVQIRRDHLLSHLLAALSASLADRLEPLQLGRLLDEVQWRLELSGQTRLTITAPVASKRVVEAWSQFG